MGIYIPNMKKPEYCRVCHERLKCKQYDGEILHTPDDCPLIEIVRCGECKYGTKIATTGKITCNLDRQVWEKTDFCSYGDRNSKNNSNQI